jgi:PAS domain S-box-containing protein
VYVVEGEALIAMELADQLARLGYQVCGVAAAGEQALPEILIAMPDLVLMDIRLAGKLTGVEVAAQLRVRADIAVVFLTAYSDPELLRAAGETEPHGFLVKPFDERSLHATIEMALYTQRMERALRLANAQLEESVRTRTAHLDEVSGRLQDMSDNASETVFQRVDVEGQRAMLDTIRRVHEQFISRAATDSAWQLLLAATMARTAADCGFIGEVEHTADGAFALRTDAMAGFTWDFAAQPAVPADLRPDAEQRSLGGMLGAVLVEGDPVVARLPVRRERPGAADSGEEVPFLTVPIVVSRELVGVVGIAERAVPLDAQALAELQPLLATYGGLIVARRNERRRRDAEDALRTLNVDLEGEVLRRASALRESEQKYVALVENISDGILRDDVDGRVVYANQRFLQWFGFEGRELREISPEDYIAPEWCERIRERHQRRVRGEKVTDRYEFQGVRSDGSRLWLDVFVAPVVEHGHIVGTQSVIREVTEQKQTERALRIISTELVTLEGEQFYTGLVERLADLLECEITYIAREDAASPTGWLAVASCVDRVVRGAGPFPVGDAAHDVIAAGGAVVASGAQQRYPSDTFLRDWGVEGFVVVPLLNRKGARIGFLGAKSRRPLAHPDRVEAILHLFGVALATEMERQRNLRLFHDLVEFSPDGIVMCDRDGRITLANRQAEEMFGWTREELMGQRVEMLVPAALRAGHSTTRANYVESAEARPMGSGRPSLDAQHRDGSTFPVEISLSPLETDDGPMVAAAIRNITERRALEQQASRRQRLDAIGTLAGGIAHDLNNALGPILMAADILRTQYTDVPDIVDTVEQSAKRAAAMVRQLLTFAKGAEGERVAVRMPDLIGEMEKIVTSTFPRNIQLAVRLARDVPAVRGDATQLHQVLLNLCVNARDAMPNGGQLGIELRTETMDAASASRMRDVDTKAGTYVVLRVRDTGNGIPAAALDKIFDPFFTTKGPDKGTGLGLSTVLGIAKGHGGFVRVASERSRGSVFAVYLPADAENAGTSAPPAERAAFSGRGETVLYVDDEAALREVATQVLARLGFTPLTAVDGTDALLLVAQRGAELRAIITDLLMPHMDGVAFVRAARRMLPSVPIIVASGRIENQVELELRALGVNGLLNKPFTQGELAEALRAALGEDDSPA